MDFPLFYSREFYWPVTILIDESFWNEQVKENNLVFECVDTGEIMISYMFFNWPVIN